MRRSQLKFPTKNAQEIQMDLSYKNIDESSGSQSEQLR